MISRAGVLLYSHAVTAGIYTGGAPILNTGHTLNVKSLHAVPIPSVYDFKAYSQAKKW